MSKIRRIVSNALALVLVVVLSGCVQSQSSTSRVVDKRKALDSYIALAVAYLQQGDRDAARRNFEKALEIDKGSAEAHNGMGLLYKLTGETALAEQSFQRAIKENRSFTQARLNYGVFLYAQNRFAEAYDAFEAASKDLSYNRRALTLAYVGQTALKLGDEARAESAFEHSLNIDNTLSLSMIELAQLYFDKEDYAQSKRYLDQYSAVAKPSPKSLWLGIRIERIFGNKDKEASYALALRNLHPYSKEYLEYKNLKNQQVPRSE
ncbi:MAG: type IV pilus biogenesis/stability protein PilW [Pseudomonadota bacterium]